MSKKLKILLIGGDGHAKSVIDVIEQENRYEIIGIVDKKLVSVNDGLMEKIKNYFVMKLKGNRINEK